MVIPVRVLWMGGLNFRQKTTQVFLKCVDIQVGNLSEIKEAAGILRQKH